MLIKVWFFLPGMPNLFKWIYVSENAKQTTGFWWPIKSRFISPVFTAHNLAALSEEAVNKYSESQVNAKSQIHLLPPGFVSLHSLIKLKSTVLHILAVPSAEDVAKRLKRHNLNRYFFKTGTYVESGLNKHLRT